MREISITEIQVDAAGRLVVVPDLPPSEDFEFIFRAGMEVTWNEAIRGLSSPVPRSGGWSHPDWFRKIIREVADEYGAILWIKPGTKWSVSQELRASIERSVAT